MPEVRIRPRTPEDVAPCLEVLAVHPAAQALYASSGWREVLQTRPSWMDSVPDDVPDVRVMVLPS